MIIIWKDANYCSSLSHRCHLCLSGQVHALSLVLNKKTTELAKASVSKLFTHMEMIG